MNLSQSKDLRSKRWLFLFFNLEQESTALQSLDAILLKQLSVRTEERSTDRPVASVEGSEQAEEVDGVF